MVTVFLPPPPHQLYFCSFSEYSLHSLFLIGIANMRLPPLSVMETWPTPNYVDPVTRGSALLIFNATFLPLVVFILAIRTYTRIHISKSFGWDDFLIILAAIPTTIYAVLQLTALYHFEWNRHMWDIEVNSGIATGIKMIMAGQVAFALGSCLTKCSMLALTYRITSTGSSKLAPYIIGIIVLIVLENITFSFLVIFQCRYVYQWLTSIRCWSVYGLTMSLVHKLFTGRYHSDLRTVSTSPGIYSRPGLLIQSLI